MHVFHVHVRLGRRHLAQAGNLARQAVDIGHGEIHARLVGRSQQVQHRVGGAAHGDVQAHRILERREVGDVARQDARVVLFVMAPRDVDDQAAGLEEQALAVGMGREDRAVAG
jgi:hypothetical protein